MFFLLVSGCQTIKQKTDKIAQKENEKLSRYIGRSVNDLKTITELAHEKNAIVKRDLDCQPCMKRVCPLKHHNCMRFVKAIDVLNEVRGF